ncbi:TPA: ABC transporter ATP-binding protein [Candidatus Ventrenecus avicola]|nr:ABC transporter ATP-binding protein [Candidatus Ventrenecus avicola]
MKETWNNLKKVYSFGKEYKKNMIVFTVSSFFAIIINVIYPIFTARQLTSLTTGLFEQLFWATLVVLLFDILGAIRMVVIRRNTQVFFRGVFQKIQMRVSQEILRITISDIDKHSSGVFIERLNHDCSELSHIFTLGVGQLTGILTNIGVLIAVFIINPVIFLYYFVASFIITCFYLRKVKILSKKEQTLRTANEKNIGLTGELVRGVRDIKMLNARDSFMKAINQSIMDVSTKIFESRNIEMNYTAFIECIRAVSEFLLVILLVYLIQIGMINVATAVVLFSYRTNIMSNLMQRIGELLNEVKMFDVSANRVFSLLDTTEFSKETFGTKHLGKVHGDFEFQDVCFSYDGKNQVLNHLSFKVPANHTVAFVGKSGAGKSTIFSLLCKMYPVTQGKILLDGVDINELDEDSIRNNITIISQNPYIFNMSIRDNLRLVKSDLSDSEMRRACKLACLDDFIETLPEGYDTVVGEGGVTLSGGQKQRLAIARAFVQRTEIILFDEATSALDNETQSKIEEAISNLQKDYTILIIAHRLSTIVNSDMIYFIENGQVLAKGTHQTLLKTCSAYNLLGTGGVYPLALAT